MVTGRFVTNVVSHLQEARLWRARGLRGLEPSLRQMALGASARPSIWDRAASWPLEIAVELTNSCNLRCVMCPVKGLTRPRGMMDARVFGRVVDECAERPEALFLPQGFGESLLHPRWESYLETARSRGVGPINIVTNGMLLDRARADLIVDIGIEAICFSIDGVDPAKYGAIRVGGDLGRVERNVRHLLRRRRERRREKPAVLVRMLRIPETEGERDPFLLRWRPEVGPQDVVALGDFCSWGGLVGGGDASPPDPVPANGRKPCRMLWRNLTVLQDGRVTPCCHDAEGKLVVGDVRRETLRKIWTGEKLEQLRDLHRSDRRNEISHCARCRDSV